MFHRIQLINHLLWYRRLFQSCGSSSYSKQLTISRFRSSDAVNSTFGSSDAVNSTFRSCDAVNSTFQVPKTFYQQILKKLHGTIALDAFLVSGLLRNAIRGDVSMNVLTDGWPEFSVVICQVLQPTISDEWSLIVYGQQIQRISDIIQHRNLFEKGKNTFLCGMTNCPQQLMEQYFPQSKKNTLVLGYASGIRRESLLHFKCHEDYILKPLRPEHAEYVSQFWPYFNSWPNRTNYLRYCIQKFPSSAAYLKDNPKEPVSWACTYETGEFAHAYTMEQHREKGIGPAVYASLFMSYQLFTPGPLYGTFQENSTFSRIAKKFGGDIQHEISYYAEIFG